MMSTLALVTREQCTPHNSIITSLWKYNVFAVGLSLLSNLVTYFVLRTRRRSTTDRRQLVPGKASINIIGNLILLVVGAFVTGLAIERSCPPGVRCPGAAYSLLIWSTRPRATAAVFLVNLPFALWATKRGPQAEPPVAPVVGWQTDSHQATPGYHDTYYKRAAVQAQRYPANPSTPALFPHDDTATERRPPSCFRFWKRKKGMRENVFFKSCVTIFVVEFFICFLGVSVWFTAAFNDNNTSHISQVGRSTCGFRVQGNTQDNKGNAWATCTPGANKMMYIAGVGMLAGFVMFALSGVIVVACSAKHSYGIRRRCDPNLPLWVVPWVFLTGAMVFNWIMWVTLLQDTADEDYCIGDINAVDTVTFVYIVIVNLWRQAV